LADIEISGRAAMEGNKGACTRDMREAQRELRLFGKYRLLFDVDRDNTMVIVLAVGEKQGNTLLVQGEEFRAHESDIAE
jgi:hypothetical protein